MRLSYLTTIQQLNYCPPLGSIAVGVLPKNYVTNIVSVKRSSNWNDGSEILELEDNDGDNDSDSVGDDENKSPKNKIPAVNRRPQQRLVCQRLVCQRND